MPSSTTVKDYFCVGRRTLLGATNLRYRTKDFVVVFALGDF